MGLNSEDASISIIRVARALKDAAGVTHSSQLGRHNSNTRNLHTVINSINLPVTQPILPTLLEAGLNHDISASIDKAYQFRAEELRQLIKQSIVAACHEIAELPVVPLAVPPDELIKKAVFTFTELYSRRLEQWKEEIVKRALRTSTKVISKNSRTFNQGYVPLLERFFEDNPFPTHADKMFLANESNMEYRQIHVWFQNRRNRTKKEGKILKRKPTQGCATKSSEKLYEFMKGQLGDSDPQAPECARVKFPGRVTETNILDASFSPLHAFPSPYPPTCYHDPFPCKTGHIHLGKPEWGREPRGKNPSTPVISIDDLVETFSRLNIRDGVRSKASPKLQSHAATVAITVIPSRAPHPSLIVRKYSPPTVLVPLRSPASGPISCPKAFRTPSPSSKPVTLIPHSTSLETNKPCGKLKIAPLPRRFPSRTQDVHRGCISPESSSPPREFFTECDTRNHFTSNVSSLSTLLDAPSFPGVFHLFEPSCRSQFDSSVHPRGLGQMVALSPGTVS